MQQSSGWRLINLLAGRDQDSSGLVNSQSNGHIVGSIPGQTIDLVNDDDNG